MRLRAGPLRLLFASRTFQWALILAGPLLCWALWPGPERSPRLLFPSRVNWDGFLALEYEGVRSRTEGRAISRKLFEKHLLALERAGYHPITLDEARDFVFQRTPLPEKALLLILGDGRRETAREAESALSMLRFPATLFLALRPMEESSYLYPSWHVLRCLAATGRWSFGMKSPAGDGRIPAPLLSSGIALGCREGAEGAGCGEGEARPTLSFTGRGYALNHRGLPPDRLTRIVADPAWGPEELVARLDSQAVRRSALVRTSEPDWVFRHGNLSVDRSRVVLWPVEGRGAEAWLAGTESWRCVRGKLSVETRPEAQAWLYLRGVPGKRSVRIGWSGRRVELQTLLPGCDVQTLASGSPPPGSSKTTISFDLFERRIRFQVEGGSAPARAFPVPGDLERGMAGLGVWLSGEDRAPVAFEGLELEPRPPLGLLVRDVVEARAAGPEAVDVLAPLWYSARREGQAALLTGHPDPALIHYAAYQGAALWPVVQLTSAFEEKSLRSLAGEIERIAAGRGIDGVLLDLRAVSPPPASVDPCWISELCESTSAPVGILPDPRIEDLVAAGPWERVARVADAGAALTSARLPPERLLCVLEALPRE